jgi:adenylate kinase
MGGPGAGKGTQSRLLEKTLGLPKISSGDLLRVHMENNTELGILARKYIDRGNLVPDEVTIPMVADRLSQPDCTKGAVLDGFPRTIAQAGALDELAEKMGTQISIVPCIDVSDEVLLARLSGRWTCREAGHVFHRLFNPPKEEGICDFDASKLYQREDDTAETQKRRIDVYVERTTPLIKFYDEKGLLVRIDGEQAIDEVHEDLVIAIKKAEPAVAS